MKAVLFALLEASLYAAALTGAILLFQAAFKTRLSARMQYLCWALVVLRLLLPAPIESGFHFEALLPERAASSPGTGWAENAGAQTPVSPVEGIPISGAQPGSGAVSAESTARENTKPTAQAPRQPLRRAVDWYAVGFAIWLFGALLSLAFFIAVKLRFARRVKGGAVPLNREAYALYLCLKLRAGVRADVRALFTNELSSPCIAMMGLRPVIFLPAALERDAKALGYAMLHELSHFARGDTAVLALLALLRCVYWFNPAAWFAFSRMQADMEAACDARVLALIHPEEKRDYLFTLLTLFTKGSLPALGMAQCRTRRLAKRRMEAAFRRPRTGRAARGAAALFCALLLFTCFTSACQPAQSALEKAIQKAPRAETAYDAPARLSLTVNGLPEDCSLIFDAAVNVPSQSAWPVYSARRADISQEQADALRVALLSGATLYDAPNARSRAEIRAMTEHYEEQLRLCEPGERQAIDGYTQILTALALEYESAPETSALTEADTTFHFIASRADAIMGDIAPYMDESGSRYEAWKRARAACASIYGVCWSALGRKMEFAADNNGQCASLSYSQTYDNFTEAAGVCPPLPQAIAEADALLAKAGLDFTLVEAQTKYGTGPFHTLVYKRALAGAAQGNFTGGTGGGAVPMQEAVYIAFTGGGLSSFHWFAPIRIDALENANVALLPFDEIAQTIAVELAKPSLWEAGLYGDEAEWVRGRRLEVTAITLSYLMIAKGGGQAGYYLLPVWNVCGEMYHRYAEGYAAGEGAYVLDENGERAAWGAGYGAGTQSFLTINAVDGSVIERAAGD